MPNPKPKTPKWTPFSSGKKGKSYIPKAGETRNAQQLKSYKNMGRGKGK